jgi:hypothetical protein
MKHRLLTRAAILGLIVHGTAFAQDHTIVVASTTSTEQSGLFGFLLPRFSRKTGIQVRIVAVGTGQALDIGRRGDADVVFVHDRPAEEKFMAGGFGVSRFDVMYNDFIVVGPLADPAHIAAGNDVVDAFRKIGRPFGDERGRASLLDGRRQSGTPNDEVFRGHPLNGTGFGAPGVSAWDRCGRFDIMQDTARADLRQDLEHRPWHRLISRDGRRRWPCGKAQHVRMLYRGVQRRWPRSRGAAPTSS